MITYQKYEQKEGGNFLKLKTLIPNEGDSVKLKCVSGEIKDGNFGVKILELQVVWNNPTTGKGEQKTFSCDAPDDVNEQAGSQLYRGFVDNNIQDNNVFEIVNGGRMNNQYKTTIYSVQKEITSNAPQDEPDKVNEEDINIENLPF